MNNVFKIYCSHIIRGPKGNKATQEEIDFNIHTFKKIGEQLRAYFLDWEKMDNYPPIELYVPADHDEFVQIAYKNKYITEEQILDVDCKIIDTCNLVISWGHPKETGSGGMKIEWDYACRNGINIYTMTEIDNLQIEALQFVIHLIIKSNGNFIIEEEE